MNQHELERLSEYLDGRLTPSDSTRLEARLASDPALAAALDALRDTRSLLRRMPRRRALRNFTLTRKMVGLKPPLPRAYPLLRFATVAAALLFAVSFIRIGPIALGASAPAAAPQAYSAAVATEAPLLAAAPAPAQELATPAAPESLTAPAEDANRTMEQPPLAKSAEEPAPQPPLLSNWQVAFAAIAVLGAAFMLLLHQLAARKWRVR